jgi:hypothetical protein
VAPYGVHTTAVPAATPKARKAGTARYSRRADAFTARYPAYRHASPAPSSTDPCRLAHSASTGITSQVCGRSRGARPSASSSPSTRAKHGYAKLCALIPTLPRATT